MRMKALQDKGVAKEGVIARLHKCIELLIDEEKNIRMPSILLKRG